MKILVTADFAEEGLELLRAHGEVIYEPWSETGALLMAEDLAEKVAQLEIDVLVVEVDLVHEEVFEARKLKVVGCCRANPLNVDDETATDEGVPVVYAPGRNAKSVADLTLAFILNLARGIVPMHRRLTSGDFDPGDLKALIDELGVARVELDALFAESDVLSLHCAVNQGTRGIVSRERIASMKDGAFFVNTARHRLVDGEALLEALRSGKLAGAGLDVFAAEPPLKDDPFLELDNVVCTPHIGGQTRDVIRHQTRMVAGDIDRILRGEHPVHCVNPEALK